MEVSWIRRIRLCFFMVSCEMQAQVFKNEVENQLGKTIKALRSDQGGEYISQEFKNYRKACEIFQQLTPPYTPQHNGVSERRNRTLLDMVRSMINLTTLPLSFWDYALESATCILNMVPTKKLDKTPYGLWYGKVHNLSYLKVWGCEALVKRDTPDKLQQGSVKYAKFLEKNLLSQEISGRAVELKEIQDEDTSPSKNTSEIPMEVEGFEPPQEEVVPVRRSEKTHQAPNRLYLNVEVDEHSLGDLNKPVNYKAAILDLESDKNPEVELRVDCYCNAGFETDRDEIKSQTGYANLNEGVWLGIVPTINEPIKMFCDNSAALLIANEPGVQRGARHYHRRYLLKVHTYENLADPFTKALPKESYSSMLRAWGLSF
ncbi:retrotransposon protein, putative, ty1-copia subclass [Tanacetum coccineum]